MLRLRRLRNISLNKKVYLDNNIRCSNCKFYLEGDKCNLYLKNKTPISTYEARVNNSLCGLNAKKFNNKYVLLDTCMAVSILVVPSICWWVVIIKSTT